MNNTYELTHYGVKGMKWGVRRNLDSKKSAYKKAKKEYNRAFNEANNRSLAAFSPNKKRRQANDARWENVLDKAVQLDKTKKEYKTAKKEFKADARAKKAAEKALAKIEKQQYKKFVNERSKEILKGESAVGKAWAVLTDAHRTQAKIEYDIDRRAKVNKAWAD